MEKIVECPNCGQDISDSYEPQDTSVGIMQGGWYYDECDEIVPDEGGPDDPE